MVKVFAGPAHPKAAFVNVGVTTIVAVTVAVPGFAATKDGMLKLVPLAASPIPGVSLVQS